MTLFSTRNVKFLLGFLSFLLIFSQPVKANDAMSLDTLRISIGVNLPVLDLTEAEDFVTLRILMNLGWGLTRLDKDLTAVSALADHWNVSRDEKTYTFTLRQAHWSNGELITPADFLRTFARTLSPQSTAKLAMPLMDLIEGAKDYKKNKISFEKVGIHTVGKDQIEIRLKHPAAYFLSLLALPVTFPQRPASEGLSLKEKSVTSGAYVIGEVKEDHLVLRPNKAGWNPAQNNLEIRVIREGSTALSLYEKNQLDLIDKLSSSDYERVKTTSDLHKDLKQAPWLTTYYLGFNQSAPPFNNVKLREALVRATDRSAVAEVLRDPQTTASSFVPTPLPTSGESFGPAFDPVIAKRLWSENHGPQNLELFFDNQDKNILITSRLQDMWKRNLGINLELRGMEWKSYLHFLKEKRPALFRFAWLAAFPDPLSHLGVFTAENPNNYTGYHSSEYDGLVEEVANLNTGVKREKLIRQAQTRLLNDDVTVMPLYHYIQYVLIRQRWQGLELTPMGLLYFGQAHPASSP